MFVLAAMLIAAPPAGADATDDFFARIKAKSHAASKKEGGAWDRCLQAEYRYGLEQTTRSAEFIVEQAFKRCRAQALDYERARYLAIKDEPEFAASLDPKNAALRLLTPAEFSADLFARTEKIMRASALDDLKRVRRAKP